jgi:hypothetical protein
MATIITRNTKGTPLTFTELDANFTNLNTAKYESGSSGVFNTLSVTTTATISGAATVASLVSAGLSTTGTFRNLSKQVVTTNTLTSATITSQNTYFTGTTGANFAITLPAVNTADLDGRVYTIMSTVARATTTWISTGGTFVGAPTALVANTPYRFQFHAATNQWFIC